MEGRDGVLLHHFMRTWHLRRVADTATPVAVPAYFPLQGFAFLLPLGGVAHDREGLCTGIVCVKLAHLFDIDQSNNQSLNQ